MTMLEAISYFFMEKLRLKRLKEFKFVNRGIGFIAGTALAGITAFAGMAAAQMFLTVLGATVLPTMGAGIATALGAIGVSSVAAATAGGAIAGLGAGALAAGSVVSSTMSLVLASPIIAPILTTLGISSLALPPVAIIAAAAIALPAVIGAIAETAIRLKGFATSWNNPADSFGVKALKTLSLGIVGLVGVPFNLITGFFRTGLNMFKKGYVGAVGETMKVAREEVVRQKETTLFGPLVSKFWDHALVGPLVGLASGLVGGIAKTGALIKERKFGLAIGTFLLSIIPLPFISPLSLYGAVRGIFGGGAAGWDTAANIRSTEIERDALVNKYEREIELTPLPPVGGMGPSSSREIAESLANRSVSVFGKDDKYSQENLRGEKAVLYHKAQILNEEAQEIRTKYRLTGDPREGQTIATIRARNKQDKADELKNKADSIDAPVVSVRRFR